MSKIAKKIYLGNWFDAQNMNFLKRSKISHILCCSAELRPMFPSHFEYKHIRANDHPAFNLSIHFDSAANFIHNAIETGTGIFIHCYAGVSRSTTCLVAYMMKYRGMTISGAINFIRKKRSIINPNPGFVQQLRNYAKRLVRQRYLNSQEAKFKRKGVMGSENEIREEQKNGEFRSGYHSVAERKMKRLKNMGKSERISKSLGPRRYNREVEKGGEKQQLDGILTMGKIKEGRRRRNSRNKKRSKTSGGNKYREVLKEKKNDNRLINGRNRKKVSFSEKMKPKIKKQKNKPFTRNEQLAIKLGFDPKILKRNMPLIANPLKPTMNYYFGGNKDPKSSFNMKSSELYKRYKMMGTGDIGLGIYGKKRGRSQNRQAKKDQRDRNSATRGAFYNRAKAGGAARSGLYNTHFLG